MRRMRADGEEYSLCQGERFWEQCAVCGIPAPFAPHPPCPLLPHGEKGEFERPDA